MLHLDHNANLARHLQAAGRLFSDEWARVFSYGRRAEAPRAATNFGLHRNREMTKLLDAMGWVAPA